MTGPVINRTVNHFGKFKQDIVTAASGAVAATSAYEHSKFYGELCEHHAAVSPFSAIIKNV